MGRIDRSRVEQMIAERLRVQVEALGLSIVVTTMGQAETPLEAGGRTVRLMLVKVTNERDGAGGAADLEVVVAVRTGAMVTDDGTTLGSVSICTGDAQRVVNALARVGLYHAASTHTVNVFGGEVEEVETADPRERAMVVRFTGQVTRETGETVAF